MKHVIKFEGFLNEAKAVVQAQVTTTKEIKIKKKIEEQIILAEQLSKEIDAASKAFKAKIDPLVETLKKYDTELVETFKTLGINQAKVKDVVVTITQGKGSTTYSYKDMYAEALAKCNAATQKVLREIQEANKHENIGKIKVEYEKTSEGLKDVWNGLVNWFKGIWKSIKDAVSDQTSAVNNLEKVAKKVEASMVKESADLNEKAINIKATQEQGLDVDLEIVGDFIYLKQGEHQIVLDKVQLAAISNYNL